jgi:hypothetical protein
VLDCSEHIFFLFTAASVSPRVAEDDRDVFVCAVCASAQGLGCDNMTAIIVRLK